MNGNCKKDVRIKALFQLYAEAIGLRAARNPKNTAKTSLMRICNKSTKINAAVRPEGGKVTKVQIERMIAYIKSNPLPDCDAEKIDKILTFHQPSNVRLQRLYFPKNPKIARREKTETARVSVEECNQFYKTWDWKRARMDALQRYGAICMCCGAKRGDTTPQGESVRIVVDHIKPISKYWYLRLDSENLQILCDECNMGKGSRLETDFRNVEPIEDDSEICWEVDEQIVAQLTDRTTGKLFH